MAEFVRVVGLRAACVMPLVARGRTIGAMAVIQAESGRRFEADDVALVGEIARRAALALDNVRLFAESRAALAQAQSAGRVKDEFLAMLGHELRNPLAPIVTSLELMARREGAAGTPERHVIERQVRHLSRLVDDLLDVSRIAAGKVELHREAIDLREVVGRALELAQPGARGPLRSARGLAFPTSRCGSTAIRCGWPRSSATCSPTPPSSRRRRGTSASSCGQVAARRCSRSPTTATAFARELLEHIFERFVQGDQSLQRARGGLGLGLAIVRNIVDLHGGTVTAASEGAGQGQPLHRHAAGDGGAGGRAPAPAPTAAAPAAAPVAPAPAKILVVDDNDDAAQAIAVLLELEGHTVRTAPTARDALAMFDEFVPDVAFLDIGLPDLNGYELARAIRTDPRAAKTRLVALTGYGREPDRQLAAQAGFDRHLVKPAEIEDLLAALEPGGVSRPARGGPSGSVRARLAQQLLEDRNHLRRPFHVRIDFDAHGESNRARAPDRRAAGGSGRRRRALRSAWGCA